MSSYPYLRYSNLPPLAGKDLFKLPPPFHMTLQPLIFFLLSGNDRMFKLILWIFCPKPEICQFSRKTWFLLVGNSILIPQRGIRDTIITVYPLFQGLSCKQSYKTRVTHMQVKINHEFIFILLIKSRITGILLNLLYLYVYVSFLHIKNFNSWKHWEWEKQNITQVLICFIL